MRHEVAIVLIVCSTLLALAPPVSDYAMNHQMTQLLLEHKMDRTDVNSSYNINLPGQPISSEYRMGCSDADVAPQMTIHWA